MNVYDFDNTIYDGESTFDFFLFCLKKKKALILYLPFMLNYILKYKSCKLSIDNLFNSTKFLSNFVLKNKELIEKYCEEFWDKNHVKLRKEFLDKLTSNDIILTASPRFLIAGALKYIDVLDKQNIICSEFNLDTGKFETICFKENKIKEFKKVFPNVSIENFYTDSLNDIPFIAISNNAYLVEKDKQGEILIRYAK